MHRPNPTELRVLHASVGKGGLAAMFGVNPATIDTWLAEAELDKPKRVVRQDVGAWRLKLDEALDNAMAVLVDALTVETHDPKDKIAQANFALKAVPILLEAKATTPGTAAAPIDRSALLAKARQVSQSADRKLRLVGS